MNMYHDADRALLDPMETASVDALRQHQLERLRWSLKHAYDNVPLYRQRFAECGAHPDDLTCLEDLAKFPFTGKNDLRDNYPYGMFAVPQEEVVRLHASSGTTGKPTVVGYTQNDINTWANVVARSIRAAGGRKGDKVHVSYGYGLFTGGLGAHYGAERLGCTVIPMLRLGIFGAEPWTDELRRSIEQRLGINALDIYGLSEIMGPGVAMECIETKDGPTIWEDHFYPEIIDPVTGEVLPDGQLGELVFTSLSKEALPMVRYRTRDLTRLLPGTARPMRRIGKITGRSDDMLIIRGVNVFPTQIEEQVLKIKQLSEMYEIHLYRNGNLDSVEVHVELRAECQHLDEGQRKLVIGELSKQIKTYIGISTQVHLQACGTLKRSEGKACHVYDKRLAS
ncbi:phenylacetate--CoA ligase [Pseudomonas putida]